MSHSQPSLPLQVASCCTQNEVPPPGHDWAVCDLPRGLFLSRFFLTMHPASLFYFWLLEQAKSIFASGLFVLIIPSAQNALPVFFWLHWVFVRACGLSCPMTCRIFRTPTRDWTCVPCIGRQILNHWPTREDPVLPIFMCFTFSYSNLILNRASPERPSLTTHSKIAVWGFPLWSSG